MMEIIMNPMGVPKSTAHLLLHAVISDLSAMKRAVTSELIACQKVIHRVYFTGFS
jgi:hypothetical protein